MVVGGRRAEVASLLGFGQGKARLILSPSAPPRVSKFAGTSIQLFNFRILHLRAFCFARSTWNSCPPSLVSYSKDRSVESPVAVNPAMDDYKKYLADQLLSEDKIVRCTPLLTWT